MTSSVKELRSKDLTTISGLRRYVVELELENKRLRASVPPVHCRDCKFTICHDGIFRHCIKNDMKVVSADGYCSEGKRRGL